MIKLLSVIGICVLWGGDCANVRFRDDSKDAFLLKTPSLHRRGGGDYDDESSIDRDDKLPSRQRNPESTPPPSLDENEVQSFLVLKLPAPFLSKGAQSNLAGVESSRNPIKATKFTANEGGFETEGELDATSGSSDASSNSASAAAFNVHESIENEFTSKVLSFRIGREKPVVRILVWRKSTTNKESSAMRFCIDVYAFHPQTNDVAVGHCPPSEETWPAGVCLIDLVLPLKWWSSKHDGARDDEGRNAYKFTKIKIGLSVYLSVAKPHGAMPSDFARPSSLAGRSSTKPFVLSAEAQYSLKIVGEVELIYPSEYALLPLNHVLKVLVPTIDYFPGTTFTVPIFIHYEPPKLNNSSIYLVQLRARASGNLLIVGVEDIDPDWRINHSVENAGKVVTFTASFRTISLNESWAGEVSVLVIKIEHDKLSADRNQQTRKVATTAQLSWSVRLVVDSAMLSEKSFLENDVSFADHSSTSAATVADVYSSGDKKNAGETISTHINVQADRVDTLSVVGDDEIVNTAVINGQHVSLPIKIISVSQGGIIDDVTLKSHCVAIDAASLKVNAECSSVYVDGSETKSNANAAIGVQCGPYRTLARYTVWYPEFPVDVWLADPVLHAISGWFVPAATATDAAAVGNSKMPQFRNRRHNEQFRHRVSHRRAKSVNGCRQKFQESEIRIYARFRAADPTTGGQSYFGGGGRKIQLDLTQMARAFLRIKNATVAKLVHTKYATYVEGLVEGRTEIQLKSPVQRHIYGSSVVETANEQVHLRSLSAEIITGLFFHTELRSVYPPIYNLAVYKSSTFFRRYQEGTVSLTLRYSDSHRTNLDVLETGYFRLHVITNGSITVFPGRRHHILSPSTDVDNDLVFLPIRILTVDEHAEGARLNITLSPPSLCQNWKSPKDAPLAFAVVPVEYLKQRRSPAKEDFDQKVALSSAEPSDPPTFAVTMAPREKSIDSFQHDQHGYGDGPLLASISVSIFAIAGVLFAACAVREGWVTVKTFARGRCRHWRFLMPLSLAVSPLVFTSRRRSRISTDGRRRTSTSSSTTNASFDEDGGSPPANRNRRGKRRRRNSRLHAECTESSVISAENEFVWLRPISLTSSMSNGPFGTGGTGAKSLNGDLERHSIAGHRSLNGELERRLASAETPNFVNVSNENDFFDRHSTRRASSGCRRDSGNVASICYSSSSSSSSTTDVGRDSKMDSVADDGIFVENESDMISNRMRANSNRSNPPPRKMSDVVQGYQKTYVLREGATTLPSGRSGSEDYGSVGSPLCPHRTKYGRNHQKHHKSCGNRRRGNSSAELLVQRLLSARSDPSVHVRPTPTTAEAAAAAVEAAKRQGRQNRKGLVFDQQKQSKKGYQRRPQSFLASPLRGSVCSASSEGTNCDVFWDSSTLGMNEDELRDYFNCLRESVT